MPDASFPEFFSQLAGAHTPPHAWQQHLAADSEPRSRLVRIPTGMGKTLGVLAAWAWHRLDRQDDAWPRRLVWCLPMRVLVEQTHATVSEALARVGLLWGENAAHTGRVGVHLLMGGVDRDVRWSLYPDEAAVIIGTQDMLLSRALNRGYAAGRARWPLEFGLLSHDVLWVMDEVQLMDVGLATSGQLQAYHEEDAGKGFRPRLTWWMSATLQPAWLETVDTARAFGGWSAAPATIPPGERDTALGAAGKVLATANIAGGDHEVLARRVLEEDGRLADQGHGRITLVVCNTVDRAVRTAAELRRLAPAQDVHLVHSRFRLAERRHWREAFLTRAACVEGADRIIVATQVVEAGVDVSAGCLVTELAPWPSLVQRFGRCARYGGSGICIVVDRGPDESAPYGAGEMEAARNAIVRLAHANEGVGLVQLEAFEDNLDDDGRRTLYPYEPRHLLLRREFEELLDTTPDLTGADLDISRFIRSGSERDLQVFWRDVPGTRRGAPRAAPPRDCRPRPEELCAVPFLLARDWLCGTETQKNRRPRLLERMRAWVWDWIEAEWTVATRSALVPGRVVCVAADCGGYTPDRGFDPGSTAPVMVVTVAATERDVEAQVETDESDAADRLSEARWKTIACHGLEVARIADQVASTMRLPDDVRRVMRLASRWHDVGKAHPAFQAAIDHPDRPPRQDLAKAPPDAWRRPAGACGTGTDRRPGFRHELASALALFAVLQRYRPDHPALLGPWRDVLRLTGVALEGTVRGGQTSDLERAVLECSAEEFDLLAYLVACHHGKVRLALHAGPRDQDYRDPGDGNGLPVRGVREGDVLPPVRLDPAADQQLAELRLTLQPAVLGLSPHTGRSWRERTIGLVERYGPGGLAWLEALLIAADRRASSLATADPDLAAEDERR